MSSMPPPPPGERSPYDGGSPAGNVGAGGFFSALFDFSFNEFITPKVVKVVYVIAAILIPLVWVVYLLLAFSQNAGLGVAVLIFGAIAVIFYLAIIRMTLEFYLAIVRMSEDIHHRLPPR